MRPLEIALHGSRIIVGAPLETGGTAFIREAVSGRRTVIISDSTVAPLYAEPLATRLGVAAHDRLIVPAGEASKSRVEWARLTDLMLASAVGRDAVIVAVGGGVVGDLAGFVAATFMRGIPVIQVPTTLLSMIDAAVGGKTGVDTPAGKNLVGAFHQPVLVLADAALLRSLPVAQLRNGLAEALKHAFITSSGELEWLLANADGLTDPARASSPVFAELVARNLQIKAGVVQSDERESGRRKALNFGHTIGHAIEATGGYTMPHGECVGVGMRAEAVIAVRLGIAPATLPERVVSALRALGLPIAPARPLSPPDVLAATRTDKKARGGAVEYALVRDIGVMAAAESGYGTPVDDAVVLAALAECLNG